MLDSFTIETKLYNKIKCYLIIDGWNIIQAVCPGGQAHFSISYKFDKKVKTIFPDIVAYNSDSILVAEIKPKLDQADYLKLLSLKDSKEGIENIIRVISLRSGKNYVHNQILFSLIHQEKNPSPVHFCYQHVYDGNLFNVIPPILE